MINNGLKSNIRRMIKDHPFIKHTTKGNTYRFVWFEDLNKVYVYRIPSFLFKHNRGEWENLGPFPINNKKEML